MNAMRQRKTTWRRRPVRKGVRRALKSRTGHWSEAVIAIGLIGLTPAATGRSLFPAEFELSSLDGSNGFVLNGVDGRFASYANGDFSGRAVSGAGDVNGDGLDDFLIGADGSNAGAKSGGACHVVFGTVTGFPAQMELDSLNGSNGFVIGGIAPYDFICNSVSGAGDVNGDGLDDILIGAQLVSSDGIYQAGASYVVFGSARDFPASINVGALDGANGFVLKGVASEDWLGKSVSGAGDVNGDGVDDILIGAKYADRDGKSWVGESYVVFGDRGGFPAELALGGLDGSNGFVLKGIAAWDLSGSSVSGVGDVNGDGFDDILIAASGASPDGKSQAGESYVVFGDPRGFPAEFELAELDGSNGFVLKGVAAEDRLGGSSGGWGGRAASGAGDVNGDGFADVLIGALRANPNGKRAAGASYVVLGTDGGFPAAMGLGSLDGSNGFVLEGVAAGDLSGRSVSGAGDVNDDGFDDILIGAPESAPNGKREAGESYVVFGDEGPFPATLALDSLDGSNGFVLTGISAGDQSGQAVSGAGDVNGDGINDILIGAHWADPGGRREAGETYVVFGRSSEGVPVGGSVSGIEPGQFRCANYETKQRVRFKANGATSWDCVAEGLAVQSGDRVWMGVQGVVTDSPSVQISGELTGATLKRVKCHNVTRDMVVIDRSVRGSSAWSCTGAGLQAVPGDVIRIGTQEWAD